MRTGKITRKTRGARLGQHFLKSKKVLERIIQEANIQLSDVVLEIGPGKGVLTRRLLEKAKKVIAIEKDVELAKSLLVQFEKEHKSKKLVLINEDVRNVSLNDLGLSSGSFKLVANIPYYITGEILRSFLGGNVKPASAVFLIQKEVAERIARSKKESILSLSVKFYGNPHYVCSVSKHNFSPPPKVDSAILSIKDISPNKKKNVDEKFFFSLIKKAFAQKRKKLTSNLKDFVSPQDLSLAFTELGIAENIRAEDIPYEKWLLLTKFLQKSSE